ncbi:TIGR02450 family Trp-rich protein [Photobacterium carnosum]|uniref:TIGR02450 family Trp-rich protein n=1 Tax=Photobacterium carnosum TaxID=2023717 RepID=A0A2N4UP29_9GAMM|nr:TIGR02450 family Trp-rich protein [Photobacterium carnosum]MCD9497237.1 TIGR02450 family Trp-rich protein [Photobacterium carnosum]MCD9514719.1 TIGR02450 family Trp-rich protein [Photobacterium carnosum]MCD9521747.1 TIGR02450 family Trp-rich protein [Photobacterium carnosum]MCD9531288.1 TIGR02450 family Trp-rich protein [Photobacterium carnosum]MCD9552411.1 TIGR02450 family Trp-rich protein [Photobacterium carnosum]
MANPVNSKALLHSKWTKVVVDHKEKHFEIVTVLFNDNQQVEKCVIQAVMTNKLYDIDWHDLKNDQVWIIGWN